MVKTVNKNGGEIDAANIQEATNLQTNNNNLMNGQP
jgi:hypothetical protein